MYYVYCLLAVLLGFLIELNVFKIVSTFGHLGWAEQYLGSGGTYTAWRLIGLVAIVGGIWAMAHPFF